MMPSADPPPIPIRTEPQIPQPRLANGLPASVAPPPPMRSAGTCISSQAELSSESDGEYELPKSADDTFINKPTPTPPPPSRPVPLPPQNDDNVYEVTDSLPAPPNRQISQTPEDDEVYEVTDLQPPTPPLPGRAAGRPVPPTPPIPDAARAVPPVQLVPKKHLMPVVSRTLPAPPADTVEEDVYQIPESDPVMSSSLGLTRPVPDPPREADEIHEPPEDMIQPEEDNTYEPPEVYTEKIPSSSTLTSPLPLAKRSLPPLPPSPAAVTSRHQPSLPPARHQDVPGKQMQLPSPPPDDDITYEPPPFAAPTSPRPSLPPARHPDVPGKQTQLPSPPPDDDITYEPPPFAAPTSPRVDNQQSSPAVLTAAPRKPPSIPDVPVHANCRTEDKLKIVSGAQPVSGINIGNDTIINHRQKLRKVANTQVFTPHQNDDTTSTVLPKLQPVSLHPAALASEVVIQAPRLPVPRKVQPPVNSNSVTESPGGPPVRVEPRYVAPPGAPQEVEPVKLQQVADHLSHFPWYFGNIDRKSAGQKVSSMRQEGAFLVRLSEKGGAEYPYTLCVLHNGETFNIQLRKRAEDQKFALGRKKPKETVHSTVDDLIRFHQNNEIEVSKESGSCGSVALTTSPPK